MAAGGPVLIMKDQLSNCIGLQYVNCKTLVDPRYGRMPIMAMSVEPYLHWVAERCVALGSLRGAYGSAVCVGCA